LDLCLRKTQRGKSHDYRAAIIFEKSKFSAFESRKLSAFKMFSVHVKMKSWRFQIPLWISVDEVLTVEMKLQFQISPV